MERKLYSMNRLKFGHQGVSEDLEMYVVDRHEMKDNLVVVTSTFLLVSIFLNEGWLPCFLPLQVNCTGRWIVLDSPSPGPVAQCHEKVITSSYL